MSACKCGHEKLLHAFAEGRCCTEGCDCVKYELKVERKGLLNRALDMDEQLELANRQIRWYQAQLKVLAGELSDADSRRLIEENQKMFDAIMQILSDPLSTRESVQARLMWFVR